MSFISDLFGGGGGDGGASQQIAMQKAEEDRKAKLREEINRLFGDGSPTMVARTVAPAAPAVAAPAAHPEDWEPPAFMRKAKKKLEDQVAAAQEPTVVYDQVPFDGSAVKGRFKAEDDEVSGALRGNYGEDLGDRYREAARQLKFSAANSGQIGGSIYADKRGDLERDNSLAGTRISEAIQRSINQLQSQREGTRTNAMNLVNSGSGAEAVSAATGGLTSALNTAKAAERERLFDDLFQGLSVGAAGSNANSKNAALAAMYRQKSGSYFPTPASDTGRVLR